MHILYHLHCRSIFVVHCTTGKVHKKNPSEVWRALKLGLPFSEICPIYLQYFHYLHTLMSFCLFHQCQIILKQKKRQLPILFLRLKHSYKKQVPPLRKKKQKLQEHKEAPIALQKDVAG